MPLVEPAAPEAAAAAAAAGPGQQPPAGAVAAGEASSAKAAKKQNGKHTGPSTPAAPPPRLTLTPERVQGIVNNLRGFQVRLRVNIVYGKKIRVYFMTGLGLGPQEAAW